MTTAGRNNEAIEQVVMRLSIEDDVSTLMLRRSFQGVRSNLKRHVRRLRGAGRAGQCE